MSDKKNVNVVEVNDMDELLGTKAATVITPDDSKKSVFSQREDSLAFLDNEPKDGSDDDDDDDSPPPKPGDLKTILDSDLDEEEDEEGSEVQNKNKGGRKPALIEAMRKLEEKGLITPFEDAPDLSEYTADDFVELIEANIATHVDEIARKAPMDVFSKLDPKIQEVVAYNLNGGKDITSILKTVAQSQEVSNLSLDKEEDQERIVREWLRETKFGTDEEIEDEITAYLDRNELDKKASQFKPKLDKKQAEIMQNKLNEQEERRKKAEEVKATYAEKIYKTLNVTHLNGLPLDNKIQTALFYGMTDTSTYQDREGNPTSELGYLIEQYQIGDNANPSILLEALWLLKDPNSYRESVKTLGKKAATADTYRALKSASDKRQPASSTQENREVPQNRENVKRRSSSRSIFSRS